ncbi:isoprenoid synthase domain-containing protein [Mycena filopes]|nr:isoprenoid synthase domain-containing protein [Mycena filopes]
MSFYDNILGKLASPVAPVESPDDKIILSPFHYLESNPGKEILDRLIAAFGSWLAVPPESRACISRLVNMLHTASLMIDDIQDASQLRRGKPAAHLVFGTAQTINSANYVYFLAYQEVLQLKNSRLPEKELIGMLTAELLCLHHGQGLELFWRDSLTCPTEEEYVAMINDKTGGLLRVMIKLMMACATTNLEVDYTPLVNLIGVFYQIRDDLMNLQSATYSNTSGFASDLTEGKFSFPLVHGVRANPDDHLILGVLQRRPSTPSSKTPVIAYLKEQTRSFEYSLGVLDNLERQARAEVARLGGNAILERILDALHVDPTALAS